jgi:hypothetical protein
MKRNATKTALLAAMSLAYGLMMYTGGASSHTATLRAEDTTITFSNQVVRIFQQHCQVCHHPGDIAPFSLMTYQDAVPWARRIKEATQSRHMPPWKPVDGCGEFQQKRGLTQEEIDTIARWVDAGAPEGAPQDLPPPLEFPDEWRLGEPDVVLDMGVDFMPDPEGGEVYRCFSIPTNFAQDTWINAIDIRPGNRAIVHHVLLFVDFDNKSVQLDQEDPGPGYTCFGAPGFIPSQLLQQLEFVVGGWAPGAQPLMTPDGVAWKIPRGARVVIQVHYSPTGSPEIDRTQIGLYFPTKPVEKQARVWPIAKRDFRIPAGRYEKVENSVSVFSSMRAIAAAPHMHLLGREMKVEAALPNGQTQCLIHINDWDFHWQGGYLYKEPLALPRGSRINVTAYYDNTADNPLNPNSPPQDVTWGERTVDEMHLFFLGFTLDFERLNQPGYSPSAVNKQLEQLLHAVSKNK